MEKYMFVEKTREIVAKQLVPAFNSKDRVLNQLQNDISLHYVSE
jgi:hypothetical protein